MKYYAHTETDNQGGHEVHNESCTRLPDTNNRAYLGDFSNCSDAVNKPKSMGYRPANGCYYCCNACHIS